MGWGPSVDKPSDSLLQANYPQILHAPYMDRPGFCHRLTAIASGTLQANAQNSAPLITYYQEEK
jgi:hypothetical protein